MNLLTLTGGNYTYNQTVTFIERATKTPIASSSAQVTSSRIASDTISAVGTLDATGDWSGQSAVTGFLSFHESWTPDGPGRIVASMTVPLVTETGGVVDAVMQTTYTFSSQVTLPGPERRDLTASLTRNGPLSIHVIYDSNVYFVPCPSDFDEDGFVTGVDFDLYVQAFEAGDMSADFDGDGFITGIDFDLFVQAFEAGC
jgi:hypothetical protein